MPDEWWFTPKYENEDVDLQPVRHALRSSLRWAKLLFTPLSLIVIALLVWEARASLGDIVRNANWIFLLVAVLLWFGSNLLSPLVTTFIFRTSGIAISYREACSIHCSRLPAKYLPGGVWHSVGRANDYLALGHRPGGVALIFIVENVLLLSVTIGLGAAMVQHLVGQHALREVMRFLPVAMVLVLLLFPPGVHMVRKHERPLSMMSYFSAAVLLLGYWAVAGLAFAAYILAFGELSVSSPISELVGIYIFSWSVGYIALFAPQGIGVSEFVAGNLLAGTSEIGQVLAFLVGFRVLVLVTDLLTWLVVVPWGSRAARQRA